MKFAVFFTILYITIFIHGREWGALEQIDFNNHVKPILSDKRFACRGQDKNKQKAHIQLDIPEGYRTSAHLEGGPRPTIVLGRPGKSHLTERILPEDPEALMPRGVPVGDFLSSVLHLVGIEHQQSTAEHRGRKSRLTYVHGHFVNIYYPNAPFEEHKMGIF